MTAASASLKRGPRGGQATRQRGGPQAPRRSGPCRRSQVAGGRTEGGHWSGPAQGAASANGRRPGWGAGARAPEPRLRGGPRGRAFEGTPRVQGRILFAEPCLGRKLAPTPPPGSLLPGGMRHCFGLRTRGRRRSWAKALEEARGPARVEAGGAPSASSSLRARVFENRRSPSSWRTTAWAPWSVRASLGLERCVAGAGPGLWRSRPAHLVSSHLPASRLVSSPDPPPKGCCRPLRWCTTW